VGHHGDRLAHGRLSVGSYGVPTGIAHQANQRLAEAWNALTDLYSRRSAFLHEARRAGYRTPEEPHALLRDQTQHAKLIEVTRRANKNMVDFSSLTPLESQTLRRVIYFYPDQLGLVPVGHDRVINPSSLNTFETAASTAQAFLDTAGGLAGVAHGQVLSDAPTPAAGTYPETGAEAAVGPYVAGGVYPRKIDRDQLAKQVAAEGNTQARLEQRTRQLVHDSLDAGMGTPPPQVLDDLHWKTELDQRLHKGQSWRPARSRLRSTLRQRPP
jgi:hypothetical protein